MTITSRTLAFYYHPAKLSRNVSVVFTFPGSKLSVAWKVAQLERIPNPAMSGKFVVEYSGRMGFSLAEVDPDDIVIPHAAVEMKKGQSTNLIMRGSEPVWTRPTNVGGKLMSAVNKTHLPQEIAFGTVNDNQGYLTLSPTSFFDVNPGETVAVDFQPRLIMYGDLDYHQNALIEENLKSKFIWEVDLTTLPQKSEWAFTETPKGDYKVAPLIY
ncbi:hypothetical protein L218DRAFT_1005436 [Marasmius fiardii PR-910]|nr:hypothetical protein L218DRAFT_1005436 [Marasmius fiardii PR-910]